MLLSVTRRRFSAGAQRQRLKRQLVVPHFGWVTVPTFLPVKCEGILVFSGVLMPLLYLLDINPHCLPLSINSNLLYRYLSPIFWQHSTLCLVYQ